MTQPDTETHKPTYYLVRLPNPVDIYFEIKADGEHTGYIRGEQHAIVLAELFVRLQGDQCDHPRESVVIVRGYEHAASLLEHQIAAICYKCGRILPEYPVDGDKEVK